MDEIAFQDKITNVSVPYNLVQSPTHCHNKYPSKSLAHSFTHPLGLSLSLTLS